MCELFLVRLYSHLSNVLFLSLVNCILVSCVYLSSEFLPLGTLSSPQNTCCLSIRILTPVLYLYCFLLSIIEYAAQFSVVGDQNSTVRTEHSQCNQASLISHLFLCEYFLFLFEANVFLFCLNNGFVLKFVSY